MLVIELCNFVLNVVVPYLGVWGAAFFVVYVDSKLTMIDW